MEFSPTVSTVWVASLRPSGKTRVVNSTSARRSGVKSPFTMALARCHLPTGCVRFTWPRATVPMGSTSRSKANTDSSSFASTGAPRRLDTRFARYRRSGAPDGTVSEILGRASSAAVWADADSEKREIPAAAKIPSAILMGPPFDGIHHSTGKAARQMPMVSTGSGASERKAQGRANLLHPFGVQVGDAASQSRLRHGNSVVQIDGATGLHSVVDIQNHFRRHAANGRRDGRDGYGRQMADRAVARQNQNRPLLVRGREPAKANLTPA